MNITRDLAYSNIASFYNKYLPSNSTMKDVALQVFETMLSNGTSLLSAYESAIKQGAVLTSAIEGAFVMPSLTAAERVDTDKVLAKADTSQLVSYFYKGASASDQADLVDAIHSGALTTSQFVTTISIIAPTGQPPAVETLVEQAAQPIYTGIALPAANLAFSGINQAQEDFLTSMYVGAFSRAPEYDGLKYWANELAGLIASGKPVNEAFLQIGKTMYVAGAQNGEGGTTLNNSDYVEFAYQNALGRQPDAGGKAYWVADLDAGRIQRGDFLTTFLTAAAKSEVDSSFLQARVAVAEFAAQKHVSGLGAPGIDLHGIIQGISSSEKALDVINGVIQKYGYGASMNTVSLFSDVAMADTTAHDAHTDFQPYPIELTGQSAPIDHSMGF